MPIHKDAFVEKYPTRVRIILFVVVWLVIFMFYLIPRSFEQREVAIQTFEQEIETIEIPPTEQFQAPPPPSRPSIPVESFDEDIAEDITIEETELEDFSWEAPPPPPDEGPVVRFIPYDEPPEPIGGYEAIQRNVRYPEIAQEAGIEGTVIVQAFVDDKGRVQETVILKGIPNTGLDEAASDAIKRTRFKPAKQRDRPVGVWISIPVNFRLRN